jgi:hypothetical protein
MRIFVLILLCFSLSKTCAQKSNITDSSDKYFNVCVFPKMAEFPGGFKAWNKYLRISINSNLGNKYIDIPKNKKSAQVTVRVCFVISKWGYVTDVERAPNDTTKVHPKLVAEAIRVIKASPRWIAERLNGKRVNSRNCQAITWQVSAE